ncbi:hypothetical protein HZS_4706 [Henneguya salminicola]|nr:hypothetical protein HZS_4706 [Henneguya salminicola]
MVSLEDFAALKTEVFDLKNQNFDLNLTNQSLIKGKYKILKLEIANLKTLNKKNEMSIGDKISSFDQKHAKSASTVSSLCKDPSKSYHISELCQACISKQNKLEDLKKELSDYKNETENLQDRLLETKLQLIKTTASNLVLEQEHTKLLDEYEFNERLNNKLQKKMDEIVDKNSNLYKTIEKLGKEYDNLKITHAISLAFLTEEFFLSLNVWNYNKILYSCKQMYEFKYLACIQHENKIFDLDKKCNILQNLYDKKTCAVKKFLSSQVINDVESRDSSIKSHQTIHDDVENKSTSSILIDSTELTDIMVKLGNLQQKNWELKESVSNLLINLL